MADNVKSVYVRFYLDKPLHKKAYHALKNQSEFSTTSSAIVAAVADYFDNLERENRLVGEIAAAFEKCAAGLSASPPATSEEKSDDAISGDIDFDFLGG